MPNFVPMNRMTLRRSSTRRNDPPMNLDRTIIKVIAPHITLTCLGRLSFRPVIASMMKISWMRVHVT